MRHLREVTIAALLDFVEARLLSGSRSADVPRVYASDAEGRVMALEFPPPESEEDRRAIGALLDMHLRDHGATLVVRQVPLVAGVELVGSESGGDAVETRRLEVAPGHGRRRAPARGGRR
jgi:hypothetical protein